MAQAGETRHRKQRNAVAEEQDREQRRSPRGRASGEQAGGEQCDRDGSAHGHDHPRIVVRDVGPQIEDRMRRRRERDRDGGEHRCNHQTEA
jgi:hypothetical protein